MTEIMRYPSRPCPGNRKKCEAAMRKQAAIIAQLRDALGIARDTLDPEMPARCIARLREIVIAALDAAGRGK